MTDGQERLKNQFYGTGGEAEQSKNSFVQLPANKQKVLIDFLERL